MGSLTGLSKEGFLPSVSRRGFLKTSSALAAASGALVSLYAPTRTFAQVPQGAQVPTFDEETFSYSSDTYNCGGWRCMHKVYVKNGRITRLTTDEEGDPEDAYHKPQVRNCLRGKAFKYRVYDPYRVKYPLELTGPRGSGQYRRVSWDYATSRIAGELKRIKSQYGSEAILGNLLSGGGYGGTYYGTLTMMEVLYSALGPISFALNDTSLTGMITGILGAEMMAAGQGISDYRQVAEHSNMVILIGFNPGSTVMLAPTNFRLAKMRERLLERGVKVYGIDPRLAHSMTSLIDEWIPVRPQTDSALMSAMAYTIIQEGLVQKDYLDRFTRGYEMFEAYVLGQTKSQDPKVSQWADGIAKTPEWAERICGLPAPKIRQLAIEYATKKPAALMLGLGPNRGAIGDQYYRMGITLAFMTGNVGVPGTWAGMGITVPPMKFAGLAPAAGMMGSYSGLGAMLGMVGMLNMPKTKVIPAVYLGDALLDPENTRVFMNQKPPVIRAIISSFGDPVSQWPASQKIAQGWIHPRVEFSATIDIVMNPTAKHSDIVLPASTQAEREDYVGLAMSGTAGGAFLKKAIDPMWESKHDLEIWQMLATKFGLGNMFSAIPSPENAVKAGVHITRMMDRKIPTYDEMKNDPKKALYKPGHGDSVALQGAYYAQVQRGVPFGTPSGKFEIYSEFLDRHHSSPAMRNMTWVKNDYPGWKDMKVRVPDIPKWTDHWEGALDPKKATYPLQIVSSRSPIRAHSSWGNNPLLHDVWGEEFVWINSQDAAARGIKDGDIVQVFNDRATVQLKAFVTNRIMPGVMSMDQGKWQQYTQPGAKGIDIGAASNTICRDEWLGSPGSGLLVAEAGPAWQTGLADVRKSADNPGAQDGPPVIHYDFSIDGVPQNVQTVPTQFVDGATWEQEKGQGKTAEANVQAYISRPQTSES